jgi:hypothetical protein
MERLKPTFNTRRESIKFKLPCDDALKETGTTNGWLAIKKLLVDDRYNVLLGTLKNYKEVVVKFGSPNAIIKEYELSKIAHNHRIPNFIKFLCLFTCNDDEEAIKHQNFICNGPGNVLGIIVMPYYPEGNLDNYHWNRSNLSVLKNVLVQAVWSLLYAYEQFNFLHGDMHIGNILLRKTKKTSLQYGEHSLNILGLYTIIMDFGRSFTKENAAVEVYKSIDRLLSLTLNMTSSDLAIEYDKTLLTEMIRKNTPITQETYLILKDIIDGLRIRYEIR